MTGEQSECECETVEPGVMGGVQMVSTDSKTGRWVGRLGWEEGAFISCVAVTYHGELTP